MEQRFGEDELDAAEGIRFPPARQEEWYRGGETRRLFDGDGGFLRA
ncbi:hypothetical protein [Paenibacillus durus]|nr:hypothetical protein [Paenibacillus durus]